MKKKIKSNKFQKPIKAQKQDRNRIYAWILLVFMVFWTVCSTLGAIAFFRDKKDDSGVITASADSYSGGSYFSSASKQFIGYAPQLNSLNIRHAASELDITLVTPLLICCNNAQLAGADFYGLGVFRYNGEIFYPQFLPDETWLRLDFRSPLADTFISHYDCYITDTYGNFDLSSMRDPVEFLGYDVSWDYVLASTEDYDGGLFTGDYDENVYNISLRVLARFKTGSGSLVGYRYFGFKISIPLLIYSTDIVNELSVTTFGYSYGNLSTATPLVIPRVDSSFNPQNHFVEGLFFEKTMLANYNFGAFWSNQTLTQQLKNEYFRGLDEGFDDGYAQGKRDGVASANDYSFLALISSIIDAPIKAFTGLFSFDLLGFNLASFFFALLSFCLVICIVKLLL